MRVQAYGQISRKSTHVAESARFRGGTRRDHEANGRAPKVATTPVPLTPAPHVKACYRGVLRKKLMAILLHVLPRTSLCCVEVRETKPFPLAARLVEDCVYEVDDASLAVDRVECRPHGV